MLTFQFLNDKIDQNTNFAKWLFWYILYIGLKFYHSKIELSQFSLVTGFCEGTRENILHIFRACSITQSSVRRLFSPFCFTKNKKIISIVAFSLNHNKQRIFDYLTNYWTKVWWLSCLFNTCNEYLILTILQISLNCPANFFLVLLV